MAYRWNKRGLFERKKEWSNLLFMMQKELGEKMQLKLSKKIKQENQDVISESYSGNDKGKVVTTEEDRLKDWNQDP